ncbi:hypothetical protein NMY22_g5087 [Coprinellus aureogranulatus]|nr:hypothetical protein NMY22_g5087 [Coprinellus aureogranulatus]
MPSLRPYPRPPPALGKCEGKANGRSSHWDLRTGGGFKRRQQLPQCIVLPAARHPKMDEYGMPLLRTTTRFFSGTPPAGWPDSILLSMPTAHDGSAKPDSEPLQGLYRVICPGVIPPSALLPPPLSCRLHHARSTTEIPYSRRALAGKAQTKCSPLTISLSAREARALQNQRAYEKLRVRENADIQVPDDVRECASTPWRFKNEATIARFRAGPASLSFGDLDLGEEDLRELSCGLPQYSPSATALPSNFAECWDILSAALYGYHLRVYMEGQVAQLSHCGMRSKVEFSDQLLRQYRNLLSRWETLVEFSLNTLGLPVELFVQICEEAITGDKAVTPFFLCRICASWRHACYKAPTLWTRPNLRRNRKDDEGDETKFKQLQLLKEWVQRAGQLPLHISLRDPVEVLTGCPIYLPLLDTLKSVSERVESLKWVFPPSHETVDNYSWPLLRDLHITMFIWHLSPMSLFDDAPQLTTLTLVHVTVTEIRTLPWINLTHLTIADGLCFDVVRSLRWASNLKALRRTDIRDYDPNDNGDMWHPRILDELPPSHFMVTHYHLQTWTFSEFNEWVTARGYLNMRLLRLPALKSFILNWEFSTRKRRYDNIHLPNATQGWGWEPEVLDLRLGSLEQGTIVEWLRNLPSVVSLKLHWKSQGEKLLPRLFEQMTSSLDSDQVILPNLESLVVEDTLLQFQPDIIIRMLQSRWDATIASPLRACIVNARRSKNPHWHLTRDNKARLEAWKRRGYTVRLQATEDSDNDRSAKNEDER